MRAGWAADTQADIAELVQYAKLRGIRLVPEIDLPSHSAGLCAGLKGAGISCAPCGKYGGQQILMDDRSVHVVQEVLREVSSLFPDALFSIGGDETGSAAPCTLASAKRFEQRMIHFVQQELHKTVLVWEEALFESGAAAGNRAVVVDTWQADSWQQAARAGHKVIMSRESALYLDYPSHNASGMWLDLFRGAENSSPTEKAMLLGASMWSDRYVPRGPAQCLYQSPQRDADFANSTSSTIWPRASIAAGSFWNFDARMRADSAEFAGLLRREAARLAARGVAVCPCSTPTRNGCWQSEFCGRAWCG